MKKDIEFLGLMMYVCGFSAVFQLASGDYPEAIIFGGLTAFLYYYANR